MKNTEDNSLEVVQQQQVQHAQAAVVPVMPEDRANAVLSIIQAGLARGMDPAGLESLVGLLKEERAHQAKREFQAALAAFQRECPQVYKNAKVEIHPKTGSTGSSYSYTFADLPYVIATIRPYMDRHGLTYQWDQELLDKSVTIWTTITHTGGHSERTAFHAAVDFGSRMNVTQQVASATSYGRRYGLLGALGIITTNEDDDGRAAGGSTITEKELEEIEALLAESGADRRRFLGMVGVEQLALMPKANLTMARNMLRARIAEKKRAQQAQREPGEEG